MLRRVLATASLAGAMVLAPAAGASPEPTEPAPAAEEGPSGGGSPTDAESDPVGADGPKEAEPAAEAEAPVPAPAAGSELKQKAQELLSEGNRLASEGDFGAALLKYRAAYELYPSVKLLLNIGTGLRHMGRNAEAAAVYERYLADSQADPARAQELRRILEELDQLVGWIDVTVSEPGVRLSLDGRVLRKHERSKPVRVDPGVHTLVGDKPGRTPTVRQVPVEARQTAEVTLALTEPGVEPAEPVAVQLIVGYSVFGLGVAGVVAGGIIGVVALSDDADADQYCADEGPYAGYCEPEGAALAADARDLGTASTVVMLASAAVGIAGLTIALTAPEQDEESAVTARLVVGPAPGARVEARW